MSNEKIGDKIRKLRSEKRITTQKGLADLLGVSPSTVGMYEQNRRIPDVDTIIRLAMIFDVSTDYLLGYEKVDSKELTATNKTQNLIRAYSDLSEEEMKKVIEYVNFLKTKRND